MTNEEKLEFIKANYKASRALELLQEGKDEFLDEWIKVLIKSIPSRLYKYRECNNNNLAALKSKKAWFSNPNTWNDQIDVTVDYNLEKDIEYLDAHFDEYVIKFALSFINQYIDSFCEQKKFVTAAKVKDAYYSAFKGDEVPNPERIISYLEPIVGWKPARQIAVKTQEAFNQVLSEDFKTRVLDGFKQILSFNDIRDKMIAYSLSETYDNDHQWAMYANDGKGYCVGYLLKPKNTLEAALLPNLLPVYYGEKKEFRLSNMLDEALEYVVRPELLSDLENQESERLFVSLNTKNPEWSGEQEWRFAVPLEQAKTNLIDFDFAEALYLGQDISDYWKRRLITIAKEQHLSVYQRKMDRLHSKWLYERVDI